MTNPVAFITGAAKRIGACTAETLHRRGYNLVLHYNHSREQAQQLHRKLNAQRPASVQLLQGDLCDMDALQPLANQAVGAFKRLDLLVNNASQFYPTPVGSISASDWHALVGSNMMAPLFLSQYCAPALTEADGNIVNMVDIHAERPLRAHTLYCMAKAALVTMTRSLAQELAPHVRVNGVAPGAILWPEQPLGDDDKQDVLQQVPAGRIGSPQDIADAIVYLTQAGYVTGQILAVDGGRSITSAGQV